MLCCRHLGSLHAAHNDALGSGHGHVFAYYVQDAGATDTLTDEQLLQLLQCQDQLVLRALKTRTGVPVATSNVGGGFRAKPRPRSAHPLGARVQSPGVQSMLQQEEHIGQLEADHNANAAGSLCVFGTAASSSAGAAGNGDSQRLRRPASAMPARRWQRPWSARPGHRKPYAPPSAEPISQRPTLHTAQRQASRPRSAVTRREHPPHVRLADGHVCEPPPFQYASMQRPQSAPAQRIASGNCCHGLQDAEGFRPRGLLTAAPPMATTVSGQRPMSASSLRSISRSASPAQPAEPPLIVEVRHAAAASAASSAIARASKSSARSPTAQYTSR